MNFFSTPTINLLYAGTVFHPLASVVPLHLKLVYDDRKFVFNSMVVIRAKRIKLKNFHGAS